MKSARARYVIVGNSVAAVAAVEAIRERDPEGGMVLLSREDRHVYSRPLISWWLAGKLDDRRMDYRPRDFYTRHRVEARLGVAAVRLDVGGRALDLSDGGRLGFEKLLLATGGAPIIPEIAGRDAAGVFTFTEWADAERIRAFLAGRGAGRKAPHAVVVGAGMIGVKAAEALVALGVGCTLVELAPRVLPAALDEAGSRLAESAIRRAGVEVRCGERVESIQAREHQVSGARLAGGREVPCDLVILAAGVAPNPELARGTGIEVDRGILVDDAMQTSAPGIYAAGDVVQAREALSGQSRPIPVWPGAFRQGRLAGLNLAGAGERYDGGLAMNAVNVFGLATISVGLAAQPVEGSEVLVTSRAEPPAYKKVVLRDGRIVGTVLVGDIDRAGIFTGLIRSGIDVTAVKPLLLTEEFGVLALPADYRKHVVSGAGIEV